MMMTHQPVKKKRGGGPKNSPIKIRKKEWEEWVYYPSHQAAVDDNDELLCLGHPLARINDVLNPNRRDKTVSGFYIVSVSLEEFQNGGPLPQVHMPMQSHDLLGGGSGLTHLLQAASQDQASAYYAAATATSSSSSSSSSSSRSQAACRKRSPTTSTSHLPYGPLPGTMQSNANFIGMNGMPFMPVYMPTRDGNDTRPFTVGGKVWTYEPNLPTMESSPPTSPGGTPIHRGPHQSNPAASTFPAPFEPSAAAAAAAATATATSPDLARKARIL